MITAKQQLRAGAAGFKTSRSAGLVAMAKLVTLPFAPRLKPFGLAAHYTAGVTSIPPPRPAAASETTVDEQPAGGAVSPPVTGVRRSSTPVTPDALRLDQALSRSGPLAQLQDRMRDSTARFNAIRDSLPPSLVPHLKPGPVDDAGWSLLAANAGVAAKLRQLRPLLEERLRQQGWALSTVRIKVLPS